MLYVPVIGQYMEEDMLVSVPGDEIYCQDCFIEGGIYCSFPLGAIVAIPEEVPEIMRCANCGKVVGTWIVS